MEDLVLEESGYCQATGIYYPKWEDSPPLPPHHDSLSLPAFLLPHRVHHHLKPAFVDAKSRRAVSYANARASISSLARLLRLRHGLRKGDVVLLVAPNSVDFPVLALAIMASGAVFSTANPMNTRAELQMQVDDSRPVLIVTTAELRHKLDGLIPTNSPPLLVDDLLQSATSCNNEWTNDDSDGMIIQQGDTAALMYSSGTTGKSKAVVCTHRNLITMGCLLRHVWGRGIGGGGWGRASEEVYLCVVPLFHMFGLSVFVCGAMAAGATVVVLANGRYSMEEAMVAVEEHGVSRLPAVPPMVVEMVRRGGVGKGYDLSSLKEVICSGAPLAREFMERFPLCYPHVTLSQCYGLTETNGPITMCDGIEGRFHVSIGRLIPCMEAKIMDMQTGKPLRPRKFGELVVRGPPVMQGYFNNQEATSMAIDKEGWLHTGDLCFIDSSGLVYVVDRIKELIKYKAYQVAPAELEETLSTHPHIKDAAVIPYPDVEVGEIPVACVVRKKDTNIKEEDIINFVAEKVAPYKKIRKVVFVDQIPRSPSGKILRRQLRAWNAPQQREIPSRL